MIKLQNYSILIIDDEEVVRNLLVQNIKTLDNIVIDTANSLQSAKLKINRNLYHLIIADYHLNPGTAIDILNLVKETNPRIPTIVITGGNDSEKEEALKNGATVFFSKPYDYLELTYVVKNLLKLYEANENLENAENIIVALSRAIDAKDSYTEGHSQRVADYSIRIYNKLGIDDQKEYKALYTGCILHDIGKLAIPDYILKSSIHPLPEDQFEIIKSHPLRGYEICKDLINLHDSLSVIRNHHETLDGKGYPDGLSEDQIPLIVQISTVSDIFDALTSNRSYRNANSKEEAIKIMREDVENGKISKYLLDILEMVL